MFILDANTVHTFLQHADKGISLSTIDARLLRETRQRVRRQWIDRSKFIPIDPVLALLELTKQDRGEDFPLYLRKFSHFFRVVYGVKNYDPAWVLMTYQPMSRLLASVHRSVQSTLQKILELSPSNGRLKQCDVLKRVDALLEWLLTERATLQIIGGPLLQLAVYSIAGSPEAHRFLKLAKVSREGVDTVSRNVAWDFMYWVSLDFHYHYAKYPSTLVCTSDLALADFLTTRKNIGRRVGRSAIMRGEPVDSSGVLNLPHLSQLDDTRLGDDIALRILDFWGKVTSDLNGETWFGASGFRKGGNP